MAQSHRTNEDLIKQTLYGSRACDGGIRLAIKIQSGIWYIKLANGPVLNFAKLKIVHISFWKMS